MHFFSLNDLKNIYITWSTLLGFRSEYIFHGASHLRNAIFCTHKTCIFHKVMRYVHYTDSHYMDDIHHTLWAKYTTWNSKHPTRPLINVIQTGSWNLAFKDFRYTIGQLLIQLGRNLKIFNNELQKKPGHRLLIVGLPSLPNRSAHPLKIVSRNNAISAVFNK